MRPSLTAYLVVGLALVVSARADDVAPSFDDLLQQRFPRWDRNADGLLSPDEVNPALDQPATRGPEAAELTLTVKPLPAGIPGNHVPAVLDYDPDRRTVEVWCPWCNNRSPKGEPGLMNGYENRNGRFTMPLADFVRTFNSLTRETSENAKFVESPVGR